MITKILLFYCAALLAAGCSCALAVLAPKTVCKARVAWSSFFLGIIFFCAYFIGVMALFHVTFASEMYYNTVPFRLFVGGVYLVLLVPVRFLIVKKAYLDREKENRALYFCAGFGAAPGAALAAYLLIMILIVCGNQLFNGPAVLEENGALSFADNTIISIFQPVAGHLSFAFSFAFFCVLSLSMGVLFQKITSGRVKPVFSVIWLILCAALEAASVLPVPFMRMLDLAHWQITLIIGACAAAVTLLARFIPAERKDESSYIKQFE